MAARGLLVTLMVWTWASALIALPPSPPPVNISFETAVAASNTDPLLVEARGRLAVPAPSLAVWFDGQAESRRPGFDWVNLDLTKAAFGFQSPSVQLGFGQLASRLAFLNRGLDGLSAVADDATNPRLTTTAAFQAETDSSTTTWGGSMGLGGPSRLEIYAYHADYYSRSLEAAGLSLTSGLPSGLLRFGVQATQAGANNHDHDPSDDPWFGGAADRYRPPRLQPSVEIFFWQDWSQFRMIAAPSLAFWGGGLALDGWATLVAGRVGTESTGFEVGIGLSGGGAAFYDQRPDQISGRLRLVWHSPLFEDWLIRVVSDSQGGLNDPEWGQAILGTTNELRLTWLLGYWTLSGSGAVTSRWLGRSGPGLVNLAGGWQALTGEAGLELAWSKGLFGWRIEGRRTAPSGERPAWQVATNLDLGWKNLSLSLSLSAQWPDLPTPRTDWSAGLKIEVAKVLGLQACLAGTGLTKLDWSGRFWLKLP